MLEFWTNIANTHTHLANISTTSANYVSLTSHGAALLIEKMLA